MLATLRLSLGLHRFVRAMLVESRPVKYSAAAEALAWLLDLFRIPLLDKGEPRRMNLGVASTSPDVHS